jgi:hypothetical protein
MQTLSEEEKNKTLAVPKKAEVTERQRLAVLYHVEDFQASHSPRRFLQFFASILQHTNYYPALDHYVRISAKGSRCSLQCQVWLGHWRFGWPPARDLSGIVGR